MNSIDISCIFEGIDDDTKEFIAKAADVKPHLSRALLQLQDDLIRGQRICPALSLIFNAFKCCSIKDVRVVILGQDPYPNPNEAMGLSFSTSAHKGRYKLPSSLENIFKCLKHNNLIGNVNFNGDLTNWTKQGVLLLNCALTTIEGQSSSHMHIWAEYTNALISKISTAIDSLVFILFGNFALKKAKLIAPRHKILTWGHPSALNPANRSDSSANFKYCTVFTDTNKYLLNMGREPINWDPNYNREQISFVCRTLDISDPIPLTIDTLWIFTDGGVKGNGKDHCIASWAFYINNGYSCIKSYGRVKPITIPRKIYRSSNNRGELTAILNALIYVYDITSHPPADKYINDTDNVNDMDEGFQVVLNGFNKIEIVTDSEYSIDCITKLFSEWKADPAGRCIHEKKNLDLITSIHDILTRLENIYTINFKHIKSHTDPPLDDSSPEWFMWHGNDVVDKLCGIALDR